MSIDFYKHNDYLGIDLYKFSWSNAKFELILPSGNRVLTIRLITSPNNQNMFFKCLSHYWEDIVNEYAADSIALVFGTSQPIFITSDDAKNPDNMLKMCRSALINMI